jgi:SAM-dependent methyltransferase
LRAIAALDSGGPFSFSHADQKQTIIHSTNYNMLTSESEDYYAEQYWAQILPMLPVKDSIKSILDLGCGQGRMSMRFASRYREAHVTGIDISEAALVTARSAAASEGIDNVVFTCSEIGEELKRTQSGSVDIAVMTEVAFYHPNWVAEFPRIVEVLKDKGLFIGSFRTTYYNVLLLLQDKRLSDAKRVMNATSGPLSSGRGFQFSWIHADELRKVMRASGLEVLSLSAVGSCSGTPGDPHAAIARPGLLKESERRILMEIEMSLSTRVPDAGRYVLVVARRSTSSTTSAGLE